ncbi:cyclophilin-like domain-containing protein [Dipodascopsis uninucleata]
MGKNTDKLFITHSEWISEDGHGGSKGISTRKREIDLAKRKLPFTHCALSLQPFQSAICDRDGNVFDRMQIASWLKKHEKNPVTGQPLHESDLIPLHFHKNEDGEYIDPVSYKVFTKNTKIVALDNTGNVFSYDTIENLNIKARYWQDLITSDKFSKSNIIVLQDPHAIIKSSKPEEAIANSNGNSVVSKRLLDTADDERIRTKKQELSAFRSASTNGRAAASLTSTAVNPYTKAERSILSDEELIFKSKKNLEKGFVQMRTNIGDIDIELETELAPRAVYNFIKLAQKGYYTGVSFHRNVKNFMIQGGDPTGTGRGGESIWGEPFIDEFDSPLSHNARGILSMANRGKNTNTSQFFITYRAVQQLDRKHTIFGKVVKGLNTLDKMERSLTDSNDRPKADITIRSILVVIDPFEEFLKKIKADEEENHSTSNKDKEKKLNDDNITWSGRVLANNDHANAKPSIRKIGKYLK